MRTFKLVPVAAVAVASVVSVVEGRAGVIQPVEEPCVIKVLGKQYTPNDLPCEKNLCLIKDTLESSHLHSDYRKAAIAEIVENIGDIYLHYHQTNHCPMNSPELEKVDEMMADLIKLSKDAVRTKADLGTITSLLQQLLLLTDEMVESLGGKRLGKSLGELLDAKEKYGGITGKITGTSSIMATAEEIRKGVCGKTTSCHRQFCNLAIEMALGACANIYDSNLSSVYRAGLDRLEEILPHYADTYTCRAEDAGLFTKIGTVAKILRDEHGRDMVGLPQLKKTITMH